MKHHDINMHGWGGPKSGHDNNAEEKRKIQGTSERHSGSFTIGLFFRLPERRAANKYREHVVLTNTLIDPASHQGLEGLV